MIMQDISQLKQHLESVLVSQDALIESLLISALAGGHLLLEGPPGVAKTTAVKALADAFHASFKRIQFTPDLMPTDILGAEILDPNTGTIRFEKGPIFNDIVLADEINRAPPKVQAALLEAMAEHQVTLGGETHPLPKFFMVLATQNPLEQGGTFPLPEAQLDRFMMKVQIHFPNAQEELEILQRVKNAPSIDLSNLVELTPDQVLVLREKITQIHVAQEIKTYMANLVAATRPENHFDSYVRANIEFGASPRATLALYEAAQARAFLYERDFVIPEDIQKLAQPILRHRIGLTYEAEGAGLTPDEVIDKLLTLVKSP